MLTVTGTGRLTADIEVKTSKQDNQYICFNLAVNKGFGEKKRAIFLQCWLHGEQQVQRMVKAGVKKGSLIEINGDLDIEEYTKKDGTKSKITKATLHDWSYAPSASKPKDGADASGNTAEDTAQESDYEEIECSDDDLPL